MNNQDFYVFTEDDGMLRYDLYHPENIIYGDTDSCYLDLSGVYSREFLDIDEVVSFSDRVGELANQAFPPYLEKVFNVAAYNKNIVQTKRETVSNKSFFQTKKRYAMNVVDDEGMRKETLKIVGLEIKKTDTPIAVKRLLSNIVEMFLENTSFEDVKQVVNDFKDTYHTLPIHEIGIPQTVRKLNEHMEKVAEQGSMKGLQMHSKGSILYNELCSSNNVKIRAGDKVLGIYIIDSEFNSICIPRELEEKDIPSFVKEFPIDWDRMWQTVQKKIDNYLIPVGLDRDSRQKKLHNSLVQY